MNFDLKTLDLQAAASEKCDLLVVLVDQASKCGDGPLGKLIADAIKAKDFAAKPGQSLALYMPAAAAARRVLLLGTGDARAASVTKALAGAGSSLRVPSVKRAVVCFLGVPDGTAVAAAVLGVAQASYVYTLTKPKAEAASLSRVVIGVPAIANVAQAFEDSKAVALGVRLAREWGNRPANHATPRLLADAAKSLAKHPRMQCKVMGPADIDRMGMGAFAAVAQGSDEPLRFIELKYNGGPRGQAPVVLIGKGITFDTGGISLKPAPEMDEMKYDMCGAASVLGTFRALAELQPDINVVGLIPACENMPDGRAVKPGDVVTSMSGQTIEILNTDAEGRLVLCDALTYSQRHKPCAIVDIATLTGACVIALGGIRTGLFASDDALGTALLEAGEVSGDLAWRMPLDDAYADGLKSNFADFGNIGGRPAGSITAAKFLQAFAGDAPWAHLDIAGTAWKGGAAKGSTGRPVGLLVQWLVSRDRSISADSAKTAIDADNVDKAAKAMGAVHSGPNIDQRSDVPVKRKAGSKKSANAAK